MLDWDYYGQTIPDFTFEVLDIPEEIAATRFAVCYPGSAGYMPTILLGVYRYFTGSIVMK